MVTFADADARRNTLGRNNKLPNSVSMDHCLRLNTISYLAIRSATCETVARNSAKYWDYMITVTALQGGTDTVPDVTQNAFIMTLPAVGVPDVTETVLIVTLTALAVPKTALRFFKE